MTPIPAATGARLSMNPSTANLAAEYASLNGCPITPRMLPMVTTRPRLARRCGIAARVTATTPKKLTSMFARYAARSHISMVGHGVGDAGVVDQRVEPPVACP